MDWLEKAITKQRDYIEYALADPLGQIADICSLYWRDRAELDLQLKKYLKRKSGHCCHLLYVIDNNGRQYSSNISDEILDEAVIGQDLSHRPYLDYIKKSGGKNFVLTDVYIDKQTCKPCITALHSIMRNNQLQGYIAADFDLKDLPLKNVDEVRLQEWRQIKGDPSIRGTLFQQTRSRSEMDEHLDEVLTVIESLMTEQGIFHAKIHFSSSRATLWPYNDPYNYRLHVLEEINSPKVCLVYEKMPYPRLASIPAKMIPKVLNVFKSLRETDETIYLRSASLNIMNGVVGLNFSCDGSHYMNAEEFLNKDINFWFGESDQKASCEN